MRGRWLAKMGSKDLFALDHPIHPAVANLRQEPTPTRLKDESFRAEMQTLSPAALRDDHARAREERSAPPAKTDSLTKRLRVPRRLGVSHPETAATKP
jgi:hypothetical protein